MTSLFEAFDLGDLATLGKPFLSKPGLVARLRNDWQPTAADPKSFYGGNARGLIDYAPYDR